MGETIDGQEVTIGIGTIVAVALLGFHRFVSETLFGIEATALATGAFAVTFLAIGVLHGAYGRQDLAAAHALAGAGLLLVAIAATGLQVAGGLLLLVSGGSYIALATVRARREAHEAPS